MKPWQVLTLGILLGLIASGLLLIIASPPRGEPVRLIPPPTVSLIIVHVSGSVVHPGVYPMAPQSRVDDAIRTAGGLRPDADPDLVNLAAPLHDGMKIQVYAAGTKPKPTVSDSLVSVFTEETVAPTESGPININTATQADLESLPGIGETRARDIIAYRESHGPFTTIDQIQAVKGIGPETYAEIKDMITVSEQP